MLLVRTYLRAVGMLRNELGLVSALVSAAIGIGFVQLAEPVFFGRVVDALSRYTQALPLIGVWALLGVASIGASVVVAVLADRLAHRQRLAALGLVFDRAITMPISYHAARGSGAVVRTLQAGSDALFSVWLMLLREQVVALASVTMLIPAAIYLDYRLAAILGVLAILYFTLNFMVIRRTSQGQSAVERYHQSVFGRVGDVVGNVTVVQSYARLTTESSALRGLMHELLKAQYPVLTWWALLTVLTRAAGTITMVAIFGFGAYLASKGQASVGEIVTFVGFATLLISKLDQISSFAARVFVLAPTLQSFFDMADLTSGVEDRPGSVTLEGVRGDVRFDHVTYRFPNSDQGIFDLDFDVTAGQTVALVGPTGAGKTTALAFLQRLRDPDEGRILIDGHDIRDVKLGSLRETISVVFQDAGLFNRSILENIRLGRPDATLEDVQRAATMAEAHEFILDKPGGYEFVMGERGSALSGGERQRIAVARAILKDAPILILDEATSALDNQTEHKLKLALDAVRKERTTFIIAHRLSTILNADLILVLEDGRIVQSGTFEALAKSEGLFARLASLGALRQDAALEAPRAGER